jgi:SNF2-related domain
LESARLAFRNGAGPFRCLAKLSFRARAYQMIPLIMALRHEPVRLLVADDVGVGKTIEALLIARELLERRVINRFAVLCLPHLCDQWQEEIRAKIVIEAVVIRSNTQARLDREIHGDASVFQHFPFQVLSIDYIKSDNRRDVFVSQCPELVILDEAHTCARPSGASPGQQQRHDLVRRIAEKAEQHLVLLTATPHSGKPEEFQSLLGLLHTDFAELDLPSATPDQRKRLAKHFVQRRRGDVLKWMLECRNQTLLGVNRLLTDDHYREKVIRQVKDPFIRAFWAEEYANYDERFKREAIAPIQNKIGQFLLNPVVRNILGQVKKKVDLPFVMDNGRLFIANLSKGQLGHDKANLLGSLLVTQFQLGAMARANRPEAERRDFYLFIDEFQNFSTDAFASILAEARKYRLCLTLSHQYIDQLSEPIRQAVFGNVGTLVAFRIGYTDSEVMTKEFGKTIPATALADLNQYEAVVKLLVSGTNREPFRAKMLPPLENRVGRRDKLIALSRERFAMPRAKIEAKLRRWMNIELSSPG